MVIEQPILGSVKALGIIFNACNTLYNGWKLSRAFGKDFSKTQHLLQAQHFFFNEIRARPLDQLAVSIGEHGSESARVEAINGILAEISAVYTQCDELIKGISRRMFFPLLKFYTKILTELQLIRGYRRNTVALARSNRVQATTMILWFTE